MDIKLDPVRRERIRAYLQNLFATEFDEALSDFRAGEVIDLMLRTMGPAIYNQAVEDVRTHLQAKLDDLPGEIHADAD